MAVRIERYQPSFKSIWDSFVKEAKNGLFLFERDYMDYHADRFFDHSLLIYKDDELVLVLPANEKEGILSSHGGLTYGGFVMSKRASVVFVVEAFQALLNYLSDHHFQTLVYKSIPNVYHKIPAQEDLYALFRADAQLYRRDVNSIIDLSQKVNYAKGTKSNLGKARKNNLKVEQSNDFNTFMAIEEEILRTKYNTRPTHTTAEIRLLAQRFPDNIQLFLVYKDQECLGGTILYITPEVVHTQYIGITDLGKEVGALDYLTDHLLQNACTGKRYFSFGISTEQDGKFLNEGLVRNKESFGARTITNDFYRINLKA